MLTLTFTLSVPQMLRIVLLVTSLSAQNGRAGNLPCGVGCARLAQEPGDGEAAAGLATTAQHSEWDNPTCTEGVVSVPRGERAVMGCNISNPFLSVAVTLSTPGASVQPLFRVRSPGCFCREGWQLRVQGGEAQLVIDNTSDAQTGCYKWHLQGLQRNIGVTTLNVSGAVSQDPKERGRLLFANPCGRETPCPPEAVDPLTEALVVSSVVVGLLFLVLGVLACIKGTGPPRYAPRKCSGPQESWF
ncbi:secreted and transmembrane protein 1 isoform X1 [Mustela erminea]|uniref:secreted and transmembrane protein 1 isoform X1 n=1 Tax=Mustela erminea TaxID=36723 RepID=UPI001386CA3A|nr:secreted and transmembrane protein 1 isoform X1 [Mustela erminea]